MILKEHVFAALVAVRAGKGGVEMKRRRSRRKQNNYIQPANHAAEAQERMRQARASGKHGKRQSDRWNKRRKAREQEQLDNGEREA
jgi:hypothetical protein